MDAPADKRMRLRYAGTCRVCLAALPARTEAIYEPSTKTVRCIDHESDATAEVVEVKIKDEVGDNENQSKLDFSDGAAGASARREFERRQTKREERIRSEHPKMGGLILALSDDPQSTRAWDTGAIGEGSTRGGFSALRGRVGPDCRP